MADKQNIVFTTKVSEQDWDKGLSAWHCSALKIPGAVLESVLVSGRSLSTSSYQVDHDQNLVRWTDFEKHPSQAVFQIKLTKELSTEELTVKWKKLAVIFPVIAALITTLIAILLPYYLNLNSKTVIIASDCEDEVRIIIPNSNETVPIPVTVKGTFKDLPPGHKIYVVVEPIEVRRYYPQVNTVVMHPDNTWNTDITVGVPGDVGGTFRVYAVLADAEAQKALDLYINEVKGTSKSPGLIDLPKGTRVCSSIRVQRS